MLDQQMMRADKVAHTKQVSRDCTPRSFLQTGGLIAEHIQGDCTRLFICRSVFLQLTLAIAR